MRASLAVNLKFGRVLIDDAKSVERVASLLSRPSFVELGRVSARRKDRWLKHAKPSADLIAKILSDAENDAVSFDNKRGSEMTASAEIENCLRGRTPASPSTIMHAHVVVPIPDQGVDVLVADMVELAEALGAGAGFISAEPRYDFAHRHALGGSRPKERAGLSELRQRGRRGRDWKEHLLATHIATVEWGTFLGAGHLARIDIANVRASGAFERVVEVSPRLAFLQVTANPMDDLSGELEAKLPAAREALAPLLMDISDVNLE